MLTHLAITASPSPLPTAVPEAAGGNFVMLIVSLAVTAIISYALGGVNGAILASKYVFGGDIRDRGSGNPGLTNALRVYGTKGAVVTLAIDTAKAAIAVLIGWWWVGEQIIDQFPEIVNANLPIMYTIGKMYAGFFAIVGHLFPAWYGFKGGKGVLVCGVTALFIHPLVGLCSIAVFVAVVALTRYVSLGSVVAGIIAFPLFTALIIRDGLMIGFAAACGVLIVLTHISNIVRLVQNKEPKFGVKAAPVRRGDDE